MDLQEIKRKLKEQVGESLSGAIKSLKEVLPEDSPRYNELLILNQRQNEANLKGIKDTISEAELQILYNQISDDLLTFIDSLSEEDFGPNTNPSSVDPEGKARQGHILYRIPDRMKKETMTECVVRIAFDEAVIIQDMDLDEHVEVQTRRVSNLMEVEIMDPSGDHPFEIQSINEPVQFVDEDHYTEWLFLIKPLLTGTYPLIIKVAVIEEIRGKERKREIVLRETIQVITEEAEAPKATEVAFKTAQETAFSLGVVAGGGATASQEAGAGTGAESPPPPSSPAPAGQSSGGLAQALSQKKGVAAISFPAFIKTVILLVAGAGLIYFGVQLFNGEEGGSSVDQEEVRDTLLPEESPPEEIMDIPEENTPVETSETPPSPSAETPEEEPVPQDESLTQLENPVIIPESDPAPEVEPQERGTTPIAPLVDQNKQRLKALTPPGMAFVEGGKFTMGCTQEQEPDCQPNEKPAVEVTVSPFYMSRFEVTFAEYDAYCEGTGHRKPYDNGWGRGKRPVIFVSWYDAVEYCNWRSVQEELEPVYTIRSGDVRIDWNANGYRLPTEAEWACAARISGKVNDKWAGTSTMEELPQFANFNTKGLTPEYTRQDFKTQLVGAYRPNQLRIHDLSGNVQEWCQDWYADDTYSQTTPGVYDPKGPSSGRDKVVRGGSITSKKDDLRISFRTKWRPSRSTYLIGFRMVRRAGDRLGS